MRKHFTTTLASAVCAALAILAAPPRDGSGCYCTNSKNIHQSAQQVFITWDPAEKLESFTIQPRFEGNADDFGIIISTPSRPKLEVMPQNFFKELATFTILEPMHSEKFKYSGPMAMTGQPGGSPTGAVTILESVVLGTLDFKIIQADRASVLFDWLKENHYSYSGDEHTLDSYIQKKWFFTAMKVDPKQMKKSGDGDYAGEITPTRFTFTTERPMYPLRMMRRCVKDKTEALFYIQAPEKMDFAGAFSFEPSWTTRWAQAMSSAIRLTEREKKELSYYSTNMISPAEESWEVHVKGEIWTMKMQLARERKDGHEPATLEWAKRITDKDRSVANTEKYIGKVPSGKEANVEFVQGQLKQGQFLTKLRKVFAKDEMKDDLEFVRAQVAGKNDDMEYVSILPTSPP